MAESSIAKQADDFYLQLLSRGKSSPYLFNSPYDEDTRRIIRSIATYVLDYIKSHTKEKDILDLLRPDAVTVTTIPYANVQALTVWMSPVHAIAVNQGLMLFVYRIARAISPHIINRAPTDPPAPPESQAVSIVATLIDWMSSPARAPLIEDWQTGPREIKTAENLTTAAERFVVSHEIGHIMHRHVMVDAGKVDVSRMTPQELDERSQDQEITADVTGAMLTIESLQDQQIDPRAGATGIVMFMRSRCWRRRSARS